MATRTVKARVELDGEREYKQALDELRKGNAVLGSEMKKLRAEYKGNTDSADYLTKRGEILERQLLQQRDVVAKLREALANSAKEFGESSAKTQEWQIKLNNAEAAMFDLEHSIKDNNDALQSQGEAMTSLSGTVEGLASKLGVQLPAGAQSALSAIESMSKGSAAALGLIGAAVAVAIAGIKALHNTTIEAAHDVDDIITQSMVSGVSTQTLQQWRYAENLIDVSVDTMTGSLSKLTKNMASAKDGNEKLSAAFADLGVEITDEDGHLRDSESVFYELIDVLGTVENETERNAAAQELLGKSAQELNPLILQGSDALKDLAAEAEATGYVLDESQIAKLGEVDDAYQRMQLTIEASRKQLAEDFAPASVGAMDLFSKAVSSGAEILEKSGLVENLASILQSAAMIGSSIIDLIKSIPGLDQALSGLKITLGAIAQFCAIIADTTDAVVGLLTLDAGRFTTALGWNAGRGQASNWQRTYMQQNGTWDQYATYHGLEGSKPYIQEGYGYDSQTGRYYDTKTGNYIVGTPVAAGWNAAGNSNWRGGLTWVGESGPELVSLPRGSQILSNQQSRSLGGDVFNITIDARSVQEFNDIIEIARSARVRSRMAGEEE